MPQGGPTGTKFTGTGSLGIGVGGQGGVGTARQVDHAGNLTLLNACTQAIQAAQEVKYSLDVATWFAEDAGQRIAVQAAAIIGIAGFTRVKLQELDVTSAKSVETMEKLNKLFGEDFPASAGMFKTTLSLLIGEVVKGNVSIDQAEKGLRDIERLLVLWGLSGKDLFKVSDVLRSILEGLRDIEREQGGSKGLEDLLGELTKK